MSGAPITAHRVLRQGHGKTTVDHVALDYDGRFLRRKVVTTDAGRRILVDLEQTLSLDDGDALVLETGDLVAIRAAAEPLLRISGSDMVRLAWHIGNRHTPCQITNSGLLIRRDRVMADMLTRLGADIVDITAPFTPEGGAYGHGRTHGHSHGTAEGGPHSHGHHHDHDSGHTHSHSHHHGIGHSHEASDHDH